MATNIKIIIFINVKTFTIKMATINQKQKEELFLQDFLNAILPPIPTQIISKENNKNDNDNDDLEQEMVYSLVSTKQANRTQLIEMKNDFEQLIKQRRAREMGLDNIRYQLAFQLFDEIIRESAIDCKERGLLLLRIRDEAKMTLQSYGILKQVASTFSINKGEKSNQGFEQLIEKRNEMVEKKKKLENKLLKLQNKLSDTQKEVQVKEEVMINELKQQKDAFENEGAHLRILIDQKRGRSGRQSRRKSLNPSTRNRISTRRAANKDSNKSFNFNALNKSPPVSPTNGLI